MEKLVVTGGERLEGSLPIPGAKNALLPILAACILTREPIVLHNCPLITDATNMTAILREIGCRVKEEKQRMEIDPSGISTYEMTGILAHTLRSSIFMLGPVLGRFRRAVFTYPGGCEIGQRPIDLHIKGLSQMGVVIEESKGFLHCDAEGLHAAELILSYPSVGTTENLMMAAVLVPGITRIHHPAKEPEIICLQEFLNAMGAKVYGAGTDMLVIEGVKKLHGAEYAIVTDRIVAGTYLTASAMTNGDVTVYAQADHLRAVLAPLQECGCIITWGNNWIRCRGPRKLKAFSILETQPYPGFPTDMQAQFFSLATIAQGTSILVENMFENRFKHAAQLKRMGAHITIKDRMAVVEGSDRLEGAYVESQDLRGGAALVLAGLYAKGVTTVGNVALIDRGYECMEQRLGQLGAKIERISGGD